MPNNTLHTKSQQIPIKTSLFSRFAFWSSFTLKTNHSQKLILPLTPQQKLKAAYQLISNKTATAEHYIKATKYLLEYQQDLSSHTLVDFHDLPHLSLDTIRHFLSKHRETANILVEDGRILHDIQDFRDLITLLDCGLPLLDKYFSCLSGYIQSGGALAIIIQTQPTYAGALLFEQQKINLLTYDKDVLTIIKAVPELAKIIINHPQVKKILDPGFYHVHLDIVSAAPTLTYQILSDYADCIKTCRFESFLEEKITAWQDNHDIAAGFILSEIYEHGLYYQQQDPKQALSIKLELADLGYVPAMMQLSKYCLAEAEAKFDKGEHAEALAMYNRIPREAAEYAAACDGIGHILYLALPPALPEEESKTYHQRIHEFLGEILSYFAEAKQFAAACQYQPNSRLHYHALASYYNHDFGAKLDNKLFNQLNELAIPIENEQDPYNDANLRVLKNYTQETSF